MLDAILNCPVPVIAALNGSAIGGGVSLLSMCDFVVAAEGAWIQMPEVDVGLMGAFAHIRRLVGERKARLLYLSGARCGVDELHAIGVVEKIVSPQELLPTAIEFAQQFAGKSPLAMRLAKEAMVRTETMGVRDAYRMEQDYTTRMLTYEDAAEAKAAMLEKRPPHWKFR
jgi:enoyl-CoA hydratase